MLRLPARFAAVILCFAPLFRQLTWRHAQVLLIGAILVPGQRTVTNILRISGLCWERRFVNYHRVLNPAAWSGRAAARVLLALLLDAFVPQGPVLLGLDDHIERRRGKCISAKGIYRDPVRSSHGHFVKASGLCWLSLMLLAEIGWAGRVWALPFLTALAPSERYAREHGRRHKKLTDWGRQVLLQTARWLPDRHIVGVADSSFSVIDLLNAVRPRICVVTRLRLDARLFDPPPPRRRGAVGRPPTIGRRQPTLAKRVHACNTRWRRMRVSGWYGRTERTVEIVSGKAIWHHPGRRGPIRYVLVRDPTDELKPQAFLCTDLEADPLDILRWFVRRWSIEVTFAEVRRHLGVETQRQWSDKAIARTTPALLGLFSLVTLWTSDPGVRRLARPRGAAWSQKGDLTFSDALAAVRRSLWAAALSSMSRQTTDITKVETAVLDRMIATLCYST